MNGISRRIAARLQAFRASGRYSYYGALWGAGIAGGLLALWLLGPPRLPVLLSFGGAYVYKALSVAVGFLLLGVWIGGRIDRMQRRVEKLEETSRGLRFLCRTDGLTGVLSRRALMERLEEEISRARRYGTALACLFIDVDDFKRLNEEEGHLFGDRALAAIAGTMRRHLRGTDVLGRYGGDEFLVILPQTGLAQAYLGAERVRRGVASLEIGGRSKGEITISVGLFVSLLGASTAPDFLRGADEALHRSKSAGKNRTVVHDHPEYAVGAGARRHSLPTNGV